MESLGQYLKTQREIRKVGLPDISDETKIAVNWLEAIEEDKWANLPGKAFARGFIKAYSKSLGLDVEDVLLRYDDAACKDVVAETPKRTKPPAYLIWIPIAAILAAALIAFFAWIL